MLVKLLVTGSILMLSDAAIAQANALADNPLNDLMTEKELAELCLESRKNNGADSTPEYCTDSFIDMALGNDEEKKRAFESLRREAEAGVAIAQFDMGYYYMQGEYVEQDDEKAFYWFNRSARNCDPGAQFNLAYLYSEGIGVNASLVEAYKWLVAAQYAENSPNRDQVDHNLSIVAAELNEEQVVEAKSEGDAIGKACARG